jgi:hypothetical protein
VRIVSDDLRDGARTRVRPFFTALFGRDAAGGSWLGPLLRAAPEGEARLGELAHATGWLQTQLAVRTADGGLGCFAYPAAAPRALEQWFVDHPEALSWPPDADMTPETTLLRRALILDDPPGSRRRAQDRARDVMARRSMLAREWWRFEDVTWLDCVLVTERLVVAVTGRREEPVGAATPWYPPRSRLVHDLEAARRLADGKAFASLVITERPQAQAAGEAVQETFAAATPHLGREERRELLAGYLGNLTWREACAATGVPFQELPDTAGELDPAAAGS